MDEATLLAALQHADAAGDSKTAASIAAQLGQLPGYGAQPAAPAAPNVMTLDRSAPDAAPAAPNVMTLDRSPQGAAAISRDYTAAKTQATEPGFAGAIDAFGRKAANVASFGLIQPLGALAEQAGSYLPWRTPETYDQALANTRGSDAAVEGAHPVANALGTAAGIGGGMVGTAKALTAVPGMALQAGAPVVNALKTIAPGAVASATDSLANSFGTQQSYGDRAVNAGLNAVVGGVGGYVLGTAASKLAGAIATPVSKGIRYLAGKIGMDPAEMATSIAQQRSAGIEPTIQGVLNQRDAGVVAGAANKNPELALGLQGGRDAALEASPTDMAAAIEQNIPTARPTYLQGVADHQQSPQTLLDARDAQMTAAIRQGANPVADRRVTVSTDLLANPLFRAAAPTVGEVVPGAAPGVSPATKLAHAAALNDAADAARIANARATGPFTTEAAQQETALAAQNANAAHAAAQARVDNNYITVGELESMRQQLGKIAGGTGKESLEAGNTVNSLGQTLAQQHPEYTGALEDYGRASKYIEGFQHGNAGEPVTSAVDLSLRQALQAPEGQQGHAAGVYINARDAALKGSQSAVQTAQMLSRNTAGNTALAAANPAAAPAVGATAQAVAQRAASVNASTPGSINVADQPGIGGVVTGIGSAALGHPVAGANKIGSAVASLFSRNTFAPDVQRQIAAGLTSGNPAVQRQMLTRLQQAGADIASLRLLSQALSGGVGSATSQVLDSRSGQ
jgi:hypothetical protein